MHCQNISGYEPVYHFSVPVNCRILYCVTLAHCPSPLVDTAPSIFFFEKRITVYAEDWRGGAPFTLCQTAILLCDVIPDGKTE